MQCCQNSLFCIHHGNRNLWRSLRHLFPCPGNKTQHHLEMHQQNQWGKVQASSCQDFRLRCGSSHCNLRHNPPLLALLHSLPTPIHSPPDFHWSWEWLRSGGGSGCLKNIVLWPPSRTAFSSRQIHGCMENSPIKTQRCFMLHLLAREAVVEPFS